MALNRFVAINKLTENELSQIYSIHKKLYFDRGIGLNFNAWVNNLNSSYHDIAIKFVYIYSSDGNSAVDGYIVYAKPSETEKYGWIKIIEIGIDITNSRDKLIVFKDMLLGLLNRYEDDFDFVSEVGFGHDRLVTIALDCGYQTISKPYYARTIMESVLNGKSFTISQENNICIINRETIYSKDYKGYIVLRKR